MTNQRIEIVSETKEAFEAKANRLLAEGWQLHGTPSFSSEEGLQIMTQMFVKPNDPIAEDRQAIRDLLGEDGGDA